MLAYYAERLHGVELNGSFYRTPPDATMLSWAAQTPEDFRFCMKAHRGLTYSGDAFDRIGLARIIGERLAPLGGRLGPILLQFPPVRQRNAALLDALLGALGRRVQEGGWQVVKAGEGMRFTPLGRVIARGIPAPGLRGAA